MQQESKATLGNLRQAPRKVRLVVDLIRGMRAEDAIAQLAFADKKAAQPVLKLLQSAIANAKINHGMQAASLVVSHAAVNPGPILYRWMPGAFGRANKLRRRTSHITLVLKGETDDTKEKKKEIRNEKREIKEIK